MEFCEDCQFQQYERLCNAEQSTTGNWSESILLSKAKKALSTGKWDHVYYICQFANNYFFWHMELKLNVKKITLYRTISFRISNLQSKCSMASFYGQIAIQLQEIRTIDCHRKRPSVDSLWMPDLDWLLTRETKSIGAFEHFSEESHEYYG